MSEPLIPLKFTSDFLESQLGECLGNLKAVLEMGLPSIRTIEIPHDGTMLIVGTGPSLAGQLDQLRKATGFILAVNEAHDYLIDNGITPHGWIYHEVSPWLKNPVQREAPGCRYFVASHCAPSTFEFLKGRDVMLWHSLQEIGEAELIHEAEKCKTFLIGGGTTPTTRAFGLGMALGYWKFETFGVDGSYATNSHVDYDSERGDWKGECHLDVWLYGRKFKTVGYLARQAWDFELLLNRVGHQISLKMHGDGLMQHMYGMYRAQRRAKELLAA